MSLGCCCGDRCLEALSESFDPVEKWSIKTDKDESRKEIGAGFLYKRAKSKPIWSRRFCTLTDTKLVYYKDSDRSEIKGTIVVAGSVAQISPNRENAKDKKYFILSHPHCGMREFYASSSLQRDQWIETLNNLSNSIKASVFYGKLKKLSSSSSSSSSSHIGVSTPWKKRWCICVGNTLDYFEHARDNQAKGSINIVGATVREVSYQDERFCFELITNTIVDSASPRSQDGKSISSNGAAEDAAAPASIVTTVVSKKHVFAAENEGDRRRWMEVIMRTSTLATPPSSSPNSFRNDGSSSIIASSNSNINGNTNSVNVNNNMNSGTDSMNPIILHHSPNQSRSSVIESGDKKIRSLPLPVPAEMTGYLLKKSPSDQKGFQSRYFILRSPGELAYYTKEEEALQGDVEAKGLIILIPSKLREPGSGIVEYNAAAISSISNSEHSLPEEFIIHTLKRSYVMKAETAEMARNWVRAIELWTLYRASCSTD